MSILIRPGDMKSGYSCAIPSSSRVLFEVFPALADSASLFTTSVHGHVRLNLFSVNVIWYTFFLVHSRAFPQTRLQLLPSIELT